MSKIDGGFLKHIENFIGSKYGRLTVIKKIGRLDKSKSVFWEVKCECGTILKKSTYQLRRKRKSKKSCRSCFLRINANPDANRRLVFNQYVGLAKARGLEFLISREDAYDIFKLNCYLCGGAPSNSCYQKKHAPIFIYNGIDRVDSSKGYIKGNVEACCIKCNQAKSNLSFSEFMEHISKIISRHGGVNV